jgi:hypothetical protein
MSGSALRRFRLASPLLAQQRVKPRMPPMNTAIGTRICASTMPVDCPLLVSTHGVLLVHAWVLFVVPLTVVPLTVVPLTVVPLTVLRVPMGDRVGTSVDISLVGCAVTPGFVTRMGLGVGRLAVTVGAFVVGIRVGLKVFGAVYTVHNTPV